MPKFATTIFAAVCVCCIQTEAGKVPRQKSVADLLKPVIVVQGEVVKVTHEDAPYHRRAITNATVAVTRVYCGPKSIQGRYFTAVSTITLTGSLRETPNHGPPQVGDVGIWSLKEDDGKLTNVACLLLKRQFPWPWKASIKGHTGAFAPYEDVVMIAEALEEISRAAASEQVALLEKHALGDRPAASIMAIMLLTEVRPDRVADLLLSLVKKPRLTISQLVLVDETLARLIGERWTGSAERMRLLEESVNASLSKDDARRLMERLSRSAQHQTISGDALLKLMREAISNTKLPLESRCVAVYIVGRYAERLAPKAEIFDLLVSVFEGTNEARIRMYAARAIHRLAPLDASQCDSIRRLLQAEKHTVESLQDVLDKSYSPPKSVSDLLQPLVLVKGRIVEVVEEHYRRPTAPYGTKVTVEIVHVYLGPKDVRGKTFVGYAPDFLPYIDKLIPYEGQPAVGDIGIFLLRSRDGELTCTSSPWLLSHFASGWSAGVKGYAKSNAPYEELLELVKALEKVSQVPPDDQLGLLEEYVRSEPSAVAVAAFELLTKLSPDRTEELVAAVAANRRLTVGGLITLDRAIARIKGKTWNESPEHMRLLERCLGASPSEEDADRLIHRLSGLARTQQIPIDTFLTFLRGMVANPWFPGEPKCRAIEEAARLVEVKTIAADAKAKVFDFLVAVLKEVDDHRVRLRAARAIPECFCPLDASQRATIKGLRRAETDKDVSKHLREALDKSWPEEG